MKKIVLTFGLIGGLIAAGWLIFSFAFLDWENLENGMWFGYASMILAFSLIFVAVKNYRDQHQDGLISFGKAFKIGLLITLVASSVYVLVWEIEYFFFIPDFMDKYCAITIAKLKASGELSAAEMASKTAEMEKMKVWYKNPLFNILISYCEIIPVGLVISLIAAGILNKKPVLGNSEQ